jgi:uncharacterized protein
MKDMPPKERTILEPVQPTVSVSRSVRPLFLACGLACVGLGYIGILVPGMPSTVFFLIALWAFKRSSPRFESWMLNHPIFGATLRNWEQNRSITVRTKVVAITLLIACIATSIALVHKTTVQVILAIVAVGVSLYIATRKTAPG